MNAVIKYPGAKWSMAQWIIDRFPPHHSYLEPFFGSGAVLFTKARSNIETVNDLDGDIVNLFEQIRRDPERLAREIYWIPYSRQVYDEAYEAMDAERDPFRRAVNFYIRMMMGHGFRTTGEKVGWKNDVQGREKAYAAHYWGKVPEVIFEAAERLRGVQIENKPALELIQRFNFPNVLIYADPPYMLETRHGKQYRHEMTDRDHMELLDALKAHKGPVMVSGYENDLYAHALRGWVRQTRRAIAQTATAREEVIWMNYEPPAEPSLFDGGGYAVSGEYHLIVRGKDWYCNIPVTRTERTGDIVEAYYGDLFVGMFDLAAVNVLYITGWERLEQMRGGGER